MGHELIVAMNVTDPAGYARYREAMAPALARFSGRFRYDLVVARTLVSEAAHPVTRVFVLAFPSAEACDAFFADEEYRRAKELHFAGSVDGFTVLGRQQTGGPAGER